MEVELKCPLCNFWFKNAVLLPCGHSICSQCVTNILKDFSDINHIHSQSTQTHESNVNSLTVMVNPLNEQDSDHLSEASEADSGVVVNSRALNSVDHSFIYVNNRPCAYSLQCPSCRRLILLDASGIDCLVQNKALDRVVKKFRGIVETEEIFCQVCSDREEILATFVCEQCEIYYCSECLSRCHPSRGPLAKHALHSAKSGLKLLDNKRRQRKSKCLCHTNEDLSLFCSNCKMIICSSCVQEFHLQHEIHPIDAICKYQKTELSQLLQSLSEKAKSGMQFIHKLKSLSEKINNNCTQKEVEVISSIDEVIEMLTVKRAELLNNLREEKSKKTAKFKEYIHQSTTALGRANGYIQFCIEMLRESDATSFILVSDALLTKVTSIEQTFIQEIEPKMGHSGDFNFQISDIETLHQIMASLRLIESPVVQYNSSTMTDFVTNDAPNAPIFWPEQCVCTDNIFTVLWQPYPGPTVQFYTLEIDDGAGGPFKKVYRGPECVCTVEGLHFQSLYGVRVKAHNQNGESGYSDVIYLQTGKFTIFTMNHKLNPNDVSITNNGLTISTESSEDRVLIGSTGLSKGVHYWEFRVDKMDPGAQPAFGIARSDCKKDEILGTDDKGWAMYINCRRSWFLHKHEHFERTDGGISVGKIVGIRLDCDKGYLSYYINDDPHGPIAFTKLSTYSYNTMTTCSSISSSGTINTARVQNFYPAVSITKAIQLTLILGREAPSESGESSEDDDTASTAILVPM